MTSIIEARSLTKAFGATVAVDHVDLKVEAGEIVGLVGVNGAGKTTLLRLLSGIHAPDSGEPLICGYGLGPEELEGKRRLAFASDAPAVFDTLTVIEHLRFVAELYRVDDWRSKADRELERFDLADRRDDVVGTLSLGLKQRTALACAFLHDPTAFLLDEPLNGLDPPTRRRLWDALRSATAAGAAVILSSHQLELVERVCTRFVLMHEGRIQWDGSAAEVRAGAAGEADLEGIFLRETAKPSLAAGGGDGVGADAGA